LNDEKVSSRRKNVGASTERRFVPVKTIRCTELDFTALEIHQKCTTTANSFRTSLPEQCFAHVQREALLSKFETKVSMQLQILPTFSPKKCTAECRVGTFFVQMR